MKMHEDRPKVGRNGQKIEPTEGSDVALVEAQSHLRVADEHRRLRELPQAAQGIWRQVSDPEERPGRLKGRKSCRRC